MRESEHVRHLTRKLDVLAVLLRDLGKIEKATRKHVALKCGINYSTLKSSCKSESVTPLIQQKLADSCGFDTSAPEWIDRVVSPSDRLAQTHSYSGRDSHEEFEAYVRRNWDLSEIPKVTLFRERPKIHRSRMAFFDIDDAGQGAMQDQPLPLFLTLSTEAQFFEAGFCFGFNKLKFELFLPEETALEATNLLGKGSSKSLSDVQVSARGTNHYPSWEMSVSSGIIDGHFVTNSDPLCELIGHSIGDEVEAELTAQLWDSSLIKQDGELIPPSNKKSIIQNLMALSINQHVHETGWICLGKQKLKVGRTLEDE